MVRLRPDLETAVGGNRDAARRRLALLAAELNADPAPTEAINPSAEPAETDVSAGRHRAPALSQRQRWAGALADHPPLGSARLLNERGVTGQHVTVIALLAAALATAGAWWVLSGRPQEQAAISPPLVRVPAEQTARIAPNMPDADPASEPVGMPASTQAATGDLAAGSTSSAVVVVDVTGRVHRPGLVTLDVGARVADAVQSAGGALPKVDLSSINLARPLVDGEQLLVGVRAATVAGAPPAAGPAPGTPSSVAGSAAPLVNLNAATLEQLDTLPGIGPVTGQSILDWRTDNGAFSSVDELLEVDGIGDVTLGDLRDLVTVGPGAQ